MSVEFRSSVIFVRDVDASREFYERLLGQTVVMDHGPNVAFEGGLSIWRVDHAFGIIFDREPELLGQLGRENMELYFETEDVDATWAALSDAGVQAVHPPREQPWGQRVFRCHDPDGHTVEVGEPMSSVIRRFLAQGLSAREVSERTSMPEELVRQISQAQESP